MYACGFNSSPYRVDGLKLDSAAISSAAIDSFHRCKWSEILRSAVADVIVSALGDLEKGFRPGMCFASSVCLSQSDRDEEPDSMICEWKNLGIDLLIEPGKILGNIA